MTYTSEFFDVIEAGALESARVIAPIVAEHVPVATVLDVGCGRGAWAKVFSQLCGSRVVGVDGPWVDRRLISDFVVFDLAARPGYELKTALLGRGHPPVTFDLAVCLEVGEHLPYHAAPDLVRALCDNASAVLFSAATPGQGGLDHVNERWPEWWAALFADRGFFPADVVRPRVWDDDRVRPWYAQNTLLYSPTALRREHPRMH